MTIPWYILAENGVLITSPTIPLSVTSSKDIIYAENAVPGLNYTPLYPNRQGNMKIAFSLPIINRKGILGNANMLASFEMLRNSDTPSLAELLKKKSEVAFRSPPQVIYSWGTHLPPLTYWVKKADFEHDTRLVNAAGFSKYTVVNMELELDETSLLYQNYKLVRRVQSLIGLGETVANALSSSRPY
jgi:hypothetical protein